MLQGPGSGDRGEPQDAAHGCLTLFTQPTTPSSAQTCFWILVMYTECEKISDLPCLFPYCLRLVPWLTQKIPIPYVSGLAPQ